MNIFRISGFISALADTLTAMCIYYIVAAVMIVSVKDWGINFFWIVLFTILTMLFWNLFLKKAKSVPFICLMTAIIFAIQIFLYIKISNTAISFKYLLMIAVASGMGVGLPLYYSFKKVQIQKHLMMIDYMVICSVACILVRNALNIDGLTTAVVIAVLALDICSAAFLRIAENKSVNSADAVRAIELTVCCAGIPVALTAVLSFVFSKSSSGIYAVFQNIGRGIIYVRTYLSMLLKWIFGHFDGNQKFESIEIEEMPSIADIENQVTQSSLNVNTAVTGAVITACIAGILLLAAIIMRRHRVSLDSNTNEAGVSPVERKRFSEFTLMDRLKKYLLFQYRVFINRNTAAGLIMYLEHKGKLRKKARYKSETMRSYITRMDTEGRLVKLADTLDYIYYNGGDNILSLQECRLMRRYIRKITK